MTTAGLNVPADSQPLPCGERMGAFDARCQAPKIQLVTAALKTSGDESASKTSPALPPTRRAKRIKQAPLAGPSVPKARQKRGSRTRTQTGPGAAGVGEAQALSTSSPQLLGSQTGRQLPRQAMQ